MRMLKKLSMRTLSTPFKRKGKRMSMEQLSKAFAEFGVSAQEAADAFQEFARYIPPFTEEDILAVKMNPSLSFIAKYRIIRNMRKQMKGEGK